MISAESFTSLRLALTLLNSLVSPVPRHSLPHSFPHSFPHSLNLFPIR
jgi:hypothetical protein